MEEEILTEGDKSQPVTDTVIYLVKIMINRSKRGPQKGPELVSGEQEPVRMGCFQEVIFQLGCRR